MPGKELDLNENTREKNLRFRHQNLVFKLFGKVQLDIAYLYSTETAIFGLDRQSAASGSLVCEISVYSSVGIYKQ